MDSGLSSAYSSAYSSAQSSAYSSLANTPRNEPSQAELKDAARDHRLAPSGRDHLSAVQHGARLPRRHEKRNRELKGRPRVRRTGGGSGGSGGSGSGSSRGSPAGSPLRRHGSVVKFDDSLDELFEFEDRPYHNLDRASWATPQYLPTGVNFINPQGRRRPLMRKRPQTPEERYAPVQDESSYSLSTRVKWKPSWSVIDSSLVSSGAATIRGRRGLEELRRMRERQSVRDAKAADEREVEADIVVKTSKVAQHLMHLRAQAKELDIQAQVDAWHARSPNKRLIGSGLFDVDVLGQNCFGLQVEPPPEVYDMAPAPALAPAPAPRKRMFSMNKGRTRFSTPEHVWKKKDWAEQELAFKRRVGITIGPRAKTSYVPRASSRKSVRGGEKSNVMDKLAEQVALAKASVGKTDPRTGEALVYYGTERPTTY
jgi:hypothetical protein